MRNSLRPVGWFATLSLVGGVLTFVAPIGSAMADEPKATPEGAAPALSDAEKEGPSYSLFDAVKQGFVSADAEGDGNGKMTISVHNRTKKPLRVVLPPGLIASGASGQFGGMGGM